jgi:hypothetical protein
VVGGGLLVGVSGEGSTVALLDGDKGRARQGVLVFEPPVPDHLGVSRPAMAVWTKGHFALPKDLGSGVITQQRDFGVSL